MWTPVDPVSFNSGTIRSRARLASLGLMYSCRRWPFPAPTEERGLPVRIGSRSGEPPFDWQAPGSWAPALDDVGAVYITYYPDLAVPGATEAIEAFCAQAMKTGVRRLVLLSGRGEEEAQRAEQALIASGG